MRRSLLLALCGLALLTLPAAAAVLPEDPATATASVGEPDEDVPYGIAASWLLGHRLLEEGRPADALPLLHQAYRAQPGVTAIALDFQAALTAEGYVRDALTVMDQLVLDNPDSTSFRLRRSALLARSGKRDDAMADLKQLRAKGDNSLGLLLAEAALLDAGGQSDRALDELREGLARFPEAAGDLYLEMAGILQRRDRNADLVPLSAEAVAAEPDRPALWLVRIRALAVAGHDDEALAAALEADKRFGTGGAGTPGEDQVEGGGAEDQQGDSFVVELADLHARSQHVDKAIALLEPLSEHGELALNPSLWLGRMLLGTGHLDEGAALVARVLARWPEAARGWFLKGRVAELKEDWPTALTHYRKAVELEPNDGELRLACVRALLIVRDKTPPGGDATALLAERKRELSYNCGAAAALVPSEDAGGRMILGYGFRAAGDLTRAAENFALAAADKDLHLNALLQKSLCHDEAGQDAEARDDLEQLRREYPDNAEVANSLGYYLAEKAVDLDRAEKMIRQALVADTGNGAYLDSLGWVLYRQGRFEDALDALIQAVNVLPEDPVILEHLGMALKAAGKPVEAAEALRRALGFGGDAKRLQTALKDLEARAAPKR